MEEIAGDLPDAVLRIIRRRLPSRVTGVQQIRGGASAGRKLLISAAETDSVFVKSARRDGPAGAYNRLVNELEVLKSLPPCAYTAPLHGAVQVDGELFLVIEGIAGRQPSFASGADRDSAIASVSGLSSLLMAFPHPPVKALSASASGWLYSLDSEWDPADSLWPRIERVKRSIQHRAQILGLLAPIQLCHWDLREDNLIIRPDRRPAVIVDWGLARIGPEWADRFRLALEFPVVEATKQLEKITRTFGINVSLMSELTSLIAYTKAFNLRNADRSGAVWDYGLETARTESYLSIAESFATVRGDT